MNEQRPKDPFAKVSTFAKLMKYEGGKGGRKLIVTDYEFTGHQLDEIDDLSAKQTEVMLTIQPSRRGTLWAGKDVKIRIKGEDHSHEVNAIGELVIEASNAMRGRMLDWFAGGVKGWDDEEMLGEHKAQIHKCVQDGEWVDALNFIMMVRNLEKAEVEVAEESEEGKDDTLFDEDKPAEELPDGLGEDAEPILEDGPSEIEEPIPPETEDIAEDDVTPEPEDEPEFDDPGND